MLDIKLQRKGSTEYVRVFEVKAPSAGSYELSESFVYPDKNELHTNIIYAPYKEGDKTAKELFQASINQLEALGYIRCPYNYF